ncbi:MAG: arylamine N-acetyltransferase [Pseudomonadota bacterium]|nr:arylamine N-acetyltransferase [Pseudomonadota bacterium]
MGFDLATYLDRIDLPSPGTGRDGLFALHRAHMTHIPFENTEPLLGKVPSLDLTDLFDKLVTRRRGGYCFEHNGLYSQALRALGFQITPLLGRVRNGAAQGGARTHQAHLVTIDDGVWLTDVGFGGHSPLEPLPVRIGVEHDAPNGRYRFSADGASGETVLERQSGADWVSLWGWDDYPVQPVDIEAANVVTACWDQAPFPSNLMASFHGAEGRVTLFNRAFSRGLPPDLDTRILEDAADLQSVLAHDFSLDLTEDEIARIWAKIEAAPVRR